MKTVIRALWLFLALTGVNAMASDFLTEGPVISLGVIDIDSSKYVGVTMDMPIGATCFADTVLLGELAGGDLPVAQANMSLANTAYAASLDLHVDFDEAVAGTCTAVNVYYPVPSP